MSLPSYYKIADNTGVNRLMCIRILGNNTQNIGNIGNIVLTVIKKVNWRKKFKLSTIIAGILVRTARGYGRKNGTYIRFDDTAVVLLKMNKTPYGSRLRGPIPMELFFRKSIKLKGYNIKFV